MASGQETVVPAKPGSRMLGPHVAATVPAHRSVAAVEEIRFRLHPKQLEVLTSQANEQLFGGGKWRWRNLLIPRHRHRLLLINPVAGILLCSPNPHPISN